MSALDLHNTLFSPEPSYSPHTPSDSRISHTRTISAITVATSSHSHPTEPLLHPSSPSSAAYRDILSRQPAHPDSPRAEWDSSLDGDRVTSIEQRGYWEQSMRRRLRRLRTVKGVLLLLIGAWAVYTSVRYFVAYVVYSTADRQAVSLSLGISSLLSLTLTIFLALRPLCLPRSILHEMPRLLRLRTRSRTTLRFCVSFFLLSPAIVNLALVFIWRRSSIASLRLEGRCRWDLDVVWVGIGGQCSTGGPAWGVWLAAALARLALTVVVLVLYYLTSRAYNTARRRAHLAPVEKTSVSPLTSPRRTFALRHMAESPVMASPTSGLPPPRPASFFGRQTAVIPEFNDGRLVGSHSRPTMSRASSVPSLTDKTSATSEDDLLGSTESGGAHKSLRRIRSSYDMNAGSSHSHASSSEEAKAVLPDDDLQGFADRFRSLVSQVSRELEEGLQLEPDDDIAAPRTPPIHHVLDTHIPYASLDEFGRPMHDERIAVLGGVVRRMPTIESVGSRELMSIRSGLPNGLNSPTTTSSMSSRPPTRATMLSLSDGASAPPSRSNSLHAAAAPPRMASELGELAREPTTSSSRSSVRGSTGTSYYTMPPGSSSTRSSEGLAGAPRSRSNSLGATEVLSPVTELGELGREDDVLGSRLSAALEEYYTAPTGGRAQAGMAEVSELGELGRAEDGSAPGSATSSTGFYSATSASTMDSASKPDS